MGHLLFLSFERFAEVGLVHLLVDLVGRVDVQLHHWSETATHVSVELLLHLDADVFIFVICAELLEQFLVLGWSFPVTFRHCQPFFL